MKISAKQKVETRQAILDAAVDLIIQNGFRATSMRAIARQAGVGDATVYNYFPTKEAIFYAYYEGRFAQAAVSLQQAEGLAEYTLQERLQALFEELLRAFLPDREFLQATFRSVFFSMSPNSRELRPIQEPFFEAVSAAFSAAKEKGELEDMLFEEVIVRLYWDYCLSVVLYWLKDESEQFTATSVLIDKTMDLGCALLRANVAAKAYDICSFLFRSHVLTRLESARPGADALKTIVTAFMEGGDGQKSTKR
ncbi:TetR/AcrR family transcriptional regulator [Solidesulfovibrio sp.]